MGEAAGYIGIGVLVGLMLGWCMMWLAMLVLSVRAWPTRIGDRDGDER